MSLVPGARLGPYEILGAIGAGGMGEVYVAQDTKLKRKVALKVLPESLAGDPERLGRLQHEAEVLASLNHPNIAAIYGLEDSTPRLALVMELVDGVPLSDRLRRNGLPLQECLKLGIQIAAGLEAAHKAGVIHRDLKPGNVIVSPSGVVKIVDFGLAKLSGASLAARDESSTKPRTAEGQVLGTVAYMSPEQTQGRPIDARSDVFSFGTVFYEMVTGTRPFRGDNAISTLAAILQHTPKPPSEMIAGPLSHDADRILLRCLRKDPDRRFQTMSDLRLALEDLKEDSESSAAHAAPAPPARRSLRRSWWVGTAVAGVMIAVASSLVFRRQPPASPPVQPMRQLTFEAGVALTPALSPDGRLLAYASDRSGEGQLDIWLKQVAGGEPVRLTTGPDSKVMPQFSPDGTRILYLSGSNQVFEVPALGGPSRRVLEQGGPFSVSSRGEIAYVRPRTATAPGPVLVAPIAGGVPKTWRPDCVAAGTPAWSPDGNGIAVAGRCETFAVEPGGLLGLLTLPRGAGPVHQLASSLDPGILEPRLFWSRLADGRDMIVIPQRAGDSINLFRLDPNGELKPLTSGAGLEHWPVLSPSGELVFARTDVTPSVWSLPLTGPMGPAKREAAPARMFGASRDGSKLVFGRMLGSVRGELVLRDLAKGMDTVLATHEVMNGGGGSFFAHVSPDGKQVAYRANVRGFAGTYIVSTEGGPTRLLEASKAFSLTSDWAPDGKTLIGECRPTTQGICVLDPTTDVAHVLLTDAQGGELLYPSYSWDGRWVTFMLRRNGATVIAATPVRSNGSLADESQWVRISPADANAARSRFSPDGSAVYYLLERAALVTLVRQSVDPATKRPLSSPVVLATVTGIRTGLMPAPIVNLVSVTRDRVFFNLAEAHGNIWATRLE